MRCQAGCCRCAGCGVLVYAPHLCPGLQHALRVPTTAQGGIHQHFAGGGLQGCYGLRSQYGHVVELLHAAGALRLAVVLLSTAAVLLPAGSITGTHRLHQRLRVPLHAGRALLPAGGHGIRAFRAGQLHQHLCRGTAHAVGQHGGVLAQARREGVYARERKGCSGNECEWMLYMLGIQLVKLSFERG